jgi:AcrR family transcriptional regulator
MVAASAETDRSAGRRRGGDTREAIERAALDLFARLGYHATSMRAIAAAAEVQPAAIYHWYESKEAILVALQNDFMEQLTERVQNAMSRQSEPAMKLAAAVGEHVVFHGLHRRAAFVTDSEIRALAPDPRRVLIARRDEYQQIFGRAIRAGIDEGSLRSSDPSVATYAILLQCTGVALWFDPDGPLPLRRVAAIHVELVLGSLGGTAELIETATERVVPGEGAS